MQEHEQWSSAVGVEQVNSEESDNGILQGAAKIKKQQFDWIRQKIIVGKSRADP